MTHFFAFLTTFALLNYKTNGQTDYADYHQEVIKCEELISEHKFAEAALKFDSLFNTYDFEFLRDCKVATELSAYTGSDELTLRFLKLGMSKGWRWNDVKKSKFLRPLINKQGKYNLKSEYDAIHAKHLERIRSPLRSQVHDLFKKDQRKAIGALLRVGDISQTRYNETKFAPHSEKQLLALNEILNKYGYPGEKFIGQNWWTSTILSHHNSISKKYVAEDTLYSHIRPKLIVALRAGEMSPYELAIIEDWKTAVAKEHNASSYGFLGAIRDEKTLDTVNKNRSEIGLRSIELRNTLIDVEQDTGMNLYLPGRPWQKGKIIAVEQ